GKHTGRTDVPLTERGRELAAEAGRVVAGEFDGPALVLTSPRSRARDTAALAGLHVDAVDERLAEWDYGEYEGLTTPEIRETAPGWELWTHPTPGGETEDQVAARADRVIARVLAEAPERALLVAHGHFLRVLASRWVGRRPRFGRHLLLGTATLSILGWERDNHTLARWNAPAIGSGPESPAP
ncbi:MAG TPA: histidine phosphatase family protein, partial [Acidimicrobiales bacterium]